MKHTIILYNPSAVFFTMPLALIALGSVFDKSKYNVLIIDARLEERPLEKIKDALKENPICFATTVLTGEPIKDALKASRFIKSQLPELPVVWGGWHPSLFPKQTLKEQCVDIVVRGQGEATFLELVDCFLNNRSLEAVNGICYKDDNVYHENNERLMLDINSFPELDYSLIDMQAYMNLSGRKQLDYISSQGCRFRCSFCADPFVFKRGWYGYSPERIGEEIEKLWKIHKFNHVHFQDETFFTSSKRVKEIAQEFIKRELPISWFATMRADQGVRLSDEIWEICKKSGLERVMIGMEAGTQEMLDWMQKDIKLNQIYEVASLCLKYNVAINFSVIVGFPKESRDSVFETLNVVKKLRQMSHTFHMGIFFYKPYPGNKIADELLESGYIFQSSLEDWSNFDYVDGKKSDWMDNETITYVENFKFYQNLAYNKPDFKKRIFQLLARWRIENSFYFLPFERIIKKYLFKKTAMS